MLEDTPKTSIDAIVAAAAETTATWASTTGTDRAKLLDGLAMALELAREELVALADEETFLGPGRLNGELARTAFQLRGFAEQVRSGKPFVVQDDPAIQESPPVGRPHLLRVRIPVGVVAMFAASNFPFAFSVLGGDTAAALAAGCPVVVKAHPGHPKLSRRIHRLALETLTSLSLDPDLLGLVEGGSTDVGRHLAQHPLIDSVAFTGSVHGGLALQSAVNERPRPIPFYGELGSTNPVIVLPGALGGNMQDAAKELAASIGAGTGQFCTSPGIVIAFKGSDTDAFLSALDETLGTLTLHTMLTPAIRNGFETAVARVESLAGITPVRSRQAPEAQPPFAFLARVPVALFLHEPTLKEEIFGPAALLVEVESTEDVIDALNAIGGSLTVTLWGASQATEETVHIVRAASKIAGRVLFSGVPTGVAVTQAQQHGGPWPSSTQPFTTSVGYAAMDRFLRPVAMQDPPDWIVRKAGVPV